MQARCGQGLLASCLLYLAIHVHAQADLPSDISEELYCSGCKATITELDRIVQAEPSKTLEKRVDKAVRNVCKAEHFKKYEYIPPKMLRTCKYIMENHEDMLSSLLSRHYSPHHEEVQPLKFLEKNFCRIITKACLHIEDNEETAKKRKAYESRAQDEIELDGTIHKIPKNAKYAKPVKFQADPDLAYSDVLPQSDDDNEIPEMSINAPAHEDDDSGHYAHTEL